VQPNFRYLLQDQKSAPGEGDPAQYALAKLHLPEAHTLAHGTNVKIAIIDSGIDATHPELAGAVAESFDALGSKEGAHVHGTGIAGVIAAHGKLMGSAPAAKILAIRAFGQAAGGAESNSYVILKSLDYAVGHGALVINMSFAGPKDALVERGITATAAKGPVMIAAAGNAGAKSPPLYPAANPNVIAVSATDPQDKLFAASNRGSYVALAAPGVDIFLPAPDAKYQMTSGTSFSAAYVSGLAALMLERNPQLKAIDVRTLLMSSAHDLGSPGRDDEFGAGEADAYAAVKAAIAAEPAPVAQSEPRKATENLAEPKENSKENTADNPQAAAPLAAAAAERSTAGESRGAAAQ
jgi:subtilisin family serine protease